MSDWADLETGLQEMRDDAEVIARREFGVNAHEAHQIVTRMPPRARDLHAHRLLQLQAGLALEGRW